MSLSSSLPLNHGGDDGVQSHDLQLVAYGPFDEWNARIARTTPELVALYTKVIIQALEVHEVTATASKLAVPIRAGGRRRRSPASNTRWSTAP